MWTKKNFHGQTPRLLVLLAVSLLLSLPSRAHENDRRTMLRSREVGSAVSDGPDDTPTVTNCLLSAVNGKDCGTVLEGCVWCAEPIYGLCVTPSAAEKMKFMPFFTCDVDVVERTIQVHVDW